MDTIFETNEFISFEFYYTQNKTKTKENTIICDLPHRIKIYRLLVRRCLEIAE